MKKIKVIWLNRLDKRLEHTLFGCSITYARDWFRRTIEESSAACLTIDEKRNSKFRLIEIKEIN